MAIDKPLTSKRILRSRQPLWAALPHPVIPQNQRLTRKAFDVVIVGAGISGALMALALTPRRLNILIVDRREPVRGSSMASTAMIQHEIDVPLHRLAKTIGVRDAGRVWQRSARAVEELASILEETGIECAFQRKQTLFLAGDSYGSRALRAEVDARTAAGISSRFVGAQELEQDFGIDRTGAIVSSISASSNPAQMTAGILAHVAKAGVEIVSETEITDCRSVGAEVVLATSHGDLITAGSVVFCTGYEFLRSMEQKSQSVISTWAIASRPHTTRPQWLDDHLVWEGSDPYLYFRSTPDGRVIVGGEDESKEGAFLDDTKARKKAQTLAEKLHDLTGIRIGKPDFTWAAAFGTTPNGLPMIGAVPGYRNVYATMGFGGNGITFSQIAATIIASEIAGHRAPDADLFPFR